VTAATEPVTVGVAEEVVQEVLWLACRLEALDLDGALRCAHQPDTARVLRLAIALRDEVGDYRPFVP
jgi:hypothetical protein